MNEPDLTYLKMRLRSLWNKMRRVHPKDIDSWEYGYLLKLNEVAHTWSKLVF